MNIEFTKTESCGAGFICVDCLYKSLDFPSLIKKLSYHKDISEKDSIICICNSRKAHAKIEVFFTDGSKNPLWGSEIFCCAQYLKEKGLSEDSLNIETDRGIKSLHLNEEGLWEAEMGKVSFASHEIPVSGMHGNIISRPIMVNYRAWPASCAVVDDSYCVLPIDDLNSPDIENLALAFENNSVFPEKINVIFNQIKKPRERKNNIKIRVWQKGRGEIPFCAGGACAVCAVDVSMNVKTIKPDKPITVNFPQGSMTVLINDEWENCQAFASVKLETVLPSQILSF